jgi:integrase
VIGKDVDDVDESSTKTNRDASVTTLQCSNGYAVVRHARAVMALLDVSRGSRKDTSPSARTISDYERKCELLDMLIEQLVEVSDPPLKVALSQYAPKRQSFFTMRAALRWRARNRVMDVLARQDRIQRTGILGGEWLKSIKELDRLTRDLQNINAIGLDECLAISERKPVKSRSKKQALRQLNSDWRDRFLEANEHSPTYRAPVLLMRHCGMRPHELELGVQVTRVGDTVRVRIHGAKVRKTAGQPWRTMLLDVARMPAWFLDEIGTQQRTVSAVAENMRSHLARISNKVFVRGCREGKRDPLISAYVFRHALATDMRANGFTTAEMAAVLGETTEDTVAWYGLRPRGGSHPLVPVAIVRKSMQTARPVRASDRGWVASAGQSARKTKATERRLRP